MKPARRISTADALAGFAGQNEFARQGIARVTDAITCSVHGRHDFQVRADDVALFRAFAEFLAAEAELQTIGISPEHVKPDAVTRDMNGERYALTGEPV